MSFCLVSHLYEDGFLGSVDFSALRYKQWHHKQIHCKDHVEYSKMLLVIFYLLVIMIF